MEGMEGPEEMDKKQTNRSDAEPTYPSTAKVIPIVLALYMSMFLVALDRTIIATAIPQITDDFHSLGDVGWYASAYMLTGCSFILLMGRVYTFYNPKIVFLTTIGLFEIGSAICGAAPNSTAFILGRAIAGAGSAGIFSGAIIIIVNLVPLHKRPIYQGMGGAVFGIASVVGPLLGGVFTSKLSWRWCFYINLPTGGVAMVILIFILKIPGATNGDTPLKQQIYQLDPIGTVFFISGIVCLLLALQWGGTTYAWSDGRIIALLVLGILLISAFIAVQKWNQDTATVPPRIAKQRSILFGMWTQFCLGGSMMIMVYYTAIWFQAIKDVSAYQSGIDTLPTVLSLVVAAISTGAMVQRIGYYTPFMIASGVIMSIGAGLISTWTPSTGHPKWIGYQIVFGYGLGLGMQQASLAAQAVLARKDVPTGVSLMMFCQQAGGAVFVSVGQNIFANDLAKGLRGISGIQPAAVVSYGATELREHVGAESIKAVVSAYNGALVKVFQTALAMACLSILGSVFMEWKSIKKDKKVGVEEAGEVEKRDAKSDDSNEEKEVE